MSGPRRASETLILRAWIDDPAHELRIRVVHVNSRSTRRASYVVASRGQVLAVIDDWLRALEAAPDE